MKYTAHGQMYCSTDDLCNLLYENADLNLENFEVDDPDLYNKAVKHLCRFTQTKKIQTNRLWQYRKL
jgi:hypothetical protein